jgi:hypothetical protein
LMAAVAEPAQPALNAADRAARVSISVNSLA